MNNEELKESLEEMYDSIVATEKRRGFLIDWEKGYADAVNEVYINMEFGRLIGSRANREGHI